MATPLHMKRMARERVNLEKPNDDYFVHFENDNLTSFHAYVIGTSETLYAHKFIKLRFDIPDKYPLVSIPVTNPGQRAAEGRLEVTGSTGSSEGYVHSTLWGKTSSQSVC